MPGEEVIAARGVNQPAACPPGRIKRLLKGGCVVQFAITLGSEIEN